MQKKLFDMGWSDELECQACHKGEGADKHRLYHCPEWQGIRREVTEASSASGSKERRLQRRSGSGKEVLSRVLSVKANGTDGISV